MEKDMDIENDLMCDTPIKEVRAYSFDYNNVKFSLKMQFDSVESPDEQTELLARTLLHSILQNLPHDSLCIDVGCGVGMHAILIGRYAKLNFKNYKIIALDCLDNAVISTTENVFKNNLLDMVAVLKSNFYEALTSFNMGNISSPVIREFRSRKNKVDLIYSNPPMMPSRISDLRDYNDEILGNLDYIKSPDCDEYTDGLGIIRQVIEKGADLLCENGKLLLVTADFLGESKIQSIFQTNGFTFSILNEAMRKIRPGGFTWQHMDIIELACNYKFLNEDGTAFENARAAKDSKQALYYKIKVYLGTLEVQ
jgi:methylase of polypeptide subunit release factors